jgi:hypothetical protein
MKWFAVVKTVDCASSNMAQSVAVSQTCILIFLTKGLVSFYYTLSMFVDALLIKLGHSLMALCKRLIFSLCAWYYPQAVLEGVGLVGYGMLESEDRSILPAIYRTKTLSSLEHWYYAMALSEIENHGKACRWLWNTSIIIGL